MASDLDRIDISLVIPAWNEADYLPRLLDTVEVARAVKMYTHLNEEMFFGRVKLPTLPQEAEDAVKTMAELIGKVTAVLRKVRTPDCWYREFCTPISVLETVGLSWDQVRARCSADGFMPVGQVLWLLGVLRSTEQVMPTDEMVFEWAGAGLSPCHLPHEWRQVLRGRKRRLIRLLQTAAELEEEVTCRF
jgi:hypothetical protein